MILVTGGAFQGKTAYAQELTGMPGEEFADGAVCPLEEIYQCRGIRRFHLWVKRAMGEGLNPEGLAKELAERNPELVVITDELGYGVVPIERRDREYRELHGRICCEVAKRSRKVCRVICGIGTVIKDD